MKHLFLILLASIQYILGANLSNLTKHCNNGNMTACSILGDMYYVAEGVPQDYTKAQNFWRRACDMKEMNACYNLGVLYQEGQGVSQDYAHAIDLYTQSCNAEHAGACLNLGFLYQYGKGVETNEEKARTFY